MSCRQLILPKKTIFHSNMSTTFAYDPLSALRNAPKLLGMELRECGTNKLCGGYYLNGDKHPWRRDKLKVFISRGVVWVAEEGDRCISLQQWLVEFGGCADYKEAIKAIKGESQILNWNEHCVRQKENVVKYVSPDVLAGAKQFELNLSPLFTWLCGMFPEERVREVFDRYNVTATPSRQTVFWYLDGDGKICHDKRIYYGFDGHRNKALPMGREYRVGDGYSSRAFFGAHLIPDSGEICLLESEKSAIIAALAFPEKTWVACGGKSNLKGITDRFVLYPDLDAIDSWTGTQGRIEEWWLNWDLPVGARPHNADFADMIIWNVKNRGHV